VPVAWANKHCSPAKDETPTNGKIRCAVKGQQIIERYLSGDADLGYQGLVQKDPSFKVPDDHQIGLAQRLA